MNVSAKAAKPTKLLHVTSRGEWRKWLEKHSKTESEVWLVYYRKASGKPRIAYNDAVEEAICFGWIGPYSSRVAIRPGISVSAMAISLRPQEASPMSLTT